MYEFKAMMERELQVLLWGEPEGRGGLYRGMLGCRTPEDIFRKQGEIQAYEGFIDLMDKVAQRLTQDQEWPRRVMNG